MISKNLTSFFSLNKTKQERANSAFDVGMAFCDGKKVKQSDTLATFFLSAMVFERVEESTGVKICVDVTRRGRHAFCSSWCTEAGNKGHRKFSWQALTTVFLWERNVICLSTNDAKSQPKARWDDNN